MHAHAVKMFPRLTHSTCLRTLWVCNIRASEENIVRMQYAGQWNLRKFSRLNYSTCMRTLWICNIRDGRPNAVGLHHQR